MNVNGANETDVREEVATPLLSALGYERGTENDILREFTISYDRNFLGRKKKDDRPLRGRADYILSVAGAGRWVLEIKAPSEERTQDTIDQAISYARHPEISGTYAAILNGKRFLVVHNSQSSNQIPMLDLNVSSPEELAAQVSNLLSPSAIRRDCSPPIVDLRRSLADGFRSSAEVTGGMISYSNFTFESSIDLPAKQKAELDEMSRRLCGYRSNIKGGRVWRDETSRIRAKLDWSAPHDAVLQFAQDKKLMDAEYVSLDEVISNDPANPTVFDVVGQVIISKGEVLFDILRWDTRIVGIATSMTYRGQAVGQIKGNILFGSFQAEYESSFPSLPIDFRLHMYALGTFEVVLDPR